MTLNSQHSSLNLKRLRVVLQGRVQGVGFRYYATDLARQLQLVGTCRNLRNGDVEIVAEGEEGALEALLVHLKNGPRTAHINNMIVVWLPATGEYRGFRIAETI